MNPYPTENNSQSQWIPTGIMAFLIHLAGADPRIFRRIKDPDIRASEAGNFAKMGFTVLIPFVLALVAGSYTIHTLQSGSPVAPPAEIAAIAGSAAPETTGQAIQAAPSTQPASSPTTGWLLAIFAGVIWATMILGIDVAIMTQLIKLPPVQKKPQNARDEPRLLDRRNQTAAAPEPVQLHRPSFFKRMILAVMRILMAATLGTVVSHCLVLGIFQKKVISQVEANREVRRKEIEANFSKQATPVKDDLAMVEGILSSPPADMVERFNAWQLSRGKSTAAGADGGAQSAPVSAVEQKFATVLKPFDDQLLRASSEMNEARKTLALITADLEEMHTEMKAAKQMRDDERLGVQKTFPAWTTSAFTQTAMPTETSGKPDQGFKWRIINETIKLAEQVIEGRTKEQKTAQDAVDRITKEIDDIKKSRTEAFNKVAGANTAQIEEMEKARAAKLTGDVKRVEAGLETQASDLKASIAKLQAQRATELKPVTGEGYDLMEQTAALHNLTSIKAGGGEQTSVLLLVGVIMLCLMFIDLTPLLMKIMRSPGYYEHALVDPYTPPAPQQPQYTSAPAYAAPVQRSAAPPPPPPGMV